MGVGRPRKNRKIVECGVYMIENPLGEIYIGASKNLKVRLASYKSVGTQTGRMADSIKKYGFKKHKFTIIEICDISCLLDQERFYIEYFEFIGANLINQNGTKKVKSYGYKNTKRKSGGLNSKPMAIFLTLEPDEVCFYKRLARKKKTNIHNMVRQIVKSKFERSKK